MYLAKVESFFWFSNIATPTSGKSGRHIQRHLRPLFISLPNPAIKESVTFWCVGWSMNAAPEATMPSSPASPPTTTPVSACTNLSASVKSQDFPRSAANSTAGSMLSTLSSSFRSVSLFLCLGNLWKVLALKRSRQYTLNIWPMTCVLEWFSRQRFNQKYDQKC